MSDLFGNHIVGFLMVMYDGRYTMGLIGKTMGLKKDTMGLQKI